MLKTSTRTVVAVVLACAALLAFCKPTQAADRSPPSRAASDPGGYPLDGVHARRLSPTIVASAGLQYRRWRGTHQYRARWAVQGDGRYLAVRFSVLAFRAHGYDEYWRCLGGCWRNGRRVVLVGTWHRVYGGEQVSIDGNLRASYLYGPTAGLQCLGSYRMVARHPYPAARPACW